jgi:hypothetical protein
MKMGMKNVFGNHFMIKIGDDNCFNKPVFRARGEGGHFSDHMKRQRKLKTFCVVKVTD